VRKVPLRPGVPEPVLNCEDASNIGDTRGQGAPDRTVTSKNVGLLGGPSAVQGLTGMFSLCPGVLEMGWPTGLGAINAAAQHPTGSRRARAQGRAVSVVSAWLAGDCVTRPVTKTG
jgi:hypothetical protein